MAHDVFVCCAAEDQARAGAICALLESDGLHCWMAPRDVAPGMAWTEAVSDAIHQSRAFVLVFSPRADSSPQVRREVEIALENRTPHLAVDIEGVRPHNLLLLQFFDFVVAADPPLERHGPQIVRRVRELLSDEGSSAIMRDLSAGSAASWLSGRRKLVDLSLGELRDGHSIARTAWKTGRVQPVFAQSVGAGSRYREPAPVGSPSRAAAPVNAGSSAVSPASSHAIPPRFKVLALAVGAAGLLYFFRSELAATAALLAKMLKLSSLTPPASAGPAPPVGKPDAVDVSAFAPLEVGRGRPFLVQVYLHRNDQDTAAIAAAAMAADPDTAWRGVRSLDLEIARGTKLTVALDAPGMLIDEASFQTITWKGEPCAVQFLVTAGHAEFDDVHIRVRILAGMVPVGQIRFALRFAKAVRAERNPPQPVGDAVVRFNRAFLSYCHEDRAEVLKRAQALQAANIAIFQDLLSLRAGEEWEPRLLAEIEQCDLFLLFWSEKARDSVWVAKEIERALVVRQNSDGKLPEIIPVILEGPPPPGPPDNLRHLHFNDPLCYMIAR